MARTKRNAILENRENRFKLPIGKIHWVSVGNKASLGYRRTKQGHGNWQGRVRIENNYKFHTVGEADDFINCDGMSVLTYFKAYEAVRVWAQDITEETLYPELKKKRLLTVGDIANNYLDWFKEHRKSYEETKHSMDAHIRPFFQDVLASQLTTVMIRDWLNTLAEKPARLRSGKGRSPSYKTPPRTEEEKRSRKASANRILTIMKAMLNKAFQDELLNDDAIWKRVKPFSNVDKPVISFLTGNESMRLLNASPTDLRELVRAALYSGARYGELSKLMVGDVNLETKSIFIRLSKSGKSRHIPLSDAGLLFFKNICIGKDADVRVFTKSDGTIWGKSHQTRPMKIACENGKVVPAVSFNELRHTYASMLAQNGVGLLEISKLLGHADTRITARHYAHLCDRTLSMAVAQLPDFGCDENINIVSIQ